MRSWFSTQTPGTHFYSSTPKSSLEKYWHSYELSFLCAQIIDEYSSRTRFECVRHRDHLSAEASRHYPSASPKPNYRINEIEENMPTFNAYLPAGRFTSEQKRALADAFHRALMESFGSPPGHRFIIISEHGEDELFIDPIFPDMRRTERAIIVTVIFGIHRTLDEKQKLAELVTRYAVESAGLTEDDISLAMLPVDNENFSFGRGLLQLAGPAPPW
jgi:phenylpyruvate tautomerase PptA (4-oxalocrotonate tautomerase family)